MLEAIRNGHLTVVRYMLDNGAHVDQQSDKYQSPLVAASAAGEAEIVALLLQSGADPSPKASLGPFTPIVAATSSGSLTTFSLIEAASEDKLKTSNDALYGTTSFERLNDRISCGSGDHENNRILQTTQPWCDFAICYKQCIICYS